MIACRPVRQSWRMSCGEAAPYLMESMIPMTLPIMGAIQVIGRAIAM